MAYRDKEKKLEWQRNRRRDPVVAEKNRAAGRKYRGQDPEKARARVAAWRHANPGKVRAYSQKYNRAHAAQIRERQRIRGKGYYLKHKFGLSAAEFAAMREAQGNACAICRRGFEKTPHVDHDHTTGRIRGLLCMNCNTGMGHLGDTAEHLEAALAYLRRDTECAR